MLTAVLDDSIAALKPNRISGIIFEDKNINCLQDQAEEGVQGILVKATPGPYFALTDSTGAFSLSVDTGSYAISKVIPKSKIKFFESCPDADLVKATFNGYGQQLKNVRLGVQIKACTQLTIDIAADRRRRCFRSQTTVTYANEGTTDAHNVQVKVLYPRYVVPIKSSLAWISRQDSVMIFDIGTLKAGERRSFLITDSTICGNEAIRGLSQCVKALISPKSTCISPSAEWDQSSVVVEASLTEEDQVASFTIANQGQGDMSDSTAYRLYANEALVEQGKVKLASGARARLAVPDPRATLRMEADQSPNHPGMSRPVASIQPAMVSPAMAAPSPVDGSYQDDADAEVSISCLPIIDSFDPNDKQVSPQGISRRHYIKAEEELEYQIRFQNTGTDTAYTVVVKDTLSSYMDVASLQIGSASHPFTYTVSGKGRPVLTFTFKNINLPDHKKNEPASHGYVRFRIAQAPGNPKGTVIRNLAYNYFDFNSPIATNEVFNIIGDTIMAPPEPMLVYDCGKQMPTLALAGEEIRLCEASETVLQANAPVHGIGRWRLLSGEATLSDPANPQSGLTAIGYGEVVLEWSIRLCEVVSRSQVKVIRYAIPPAPVLAAPALQCEGSQLQPLMAAGSNITWYADADKQQTLYTGNGLVPQIQATTTFYASQTVNGCESPVASVVVQVQPAAVSFAVHHDTLVAPQADGYQWYFNGQPIEGATGQKFFARNTGSYRLQSITQGCVSTSSAMAITKNLPEATLSFGPNPTSGRLHLELTANETGPVRIVIWDRLGRETRSFKALKPHTVLEQSLDLGNLSAGLYLLEVQLGQQVLTRKFVQK
ncbi:MAG: DUF7619 domain-containing protein [Adhaeribacter sp.]